MVKLNDSENKDQNHSTCEGGDMKNRIRQSYPYGPVKSGAGQYVDDVKNTAVTVPSFNLPQSDFLSFETLQALKQAEIEGKESGEKLVALNCALESSPISEIPSLRQSIANVFYDSPVYKNATKRYRVSAQFGALGGVNIETFLPIDGVANHNQERILINLHGGGFMQGARTLSHVESMPIAALGRIKVISVDYSLAPESEYPKANNDIFLVYKALLEKYKPENIGIYGCSAGAVLTAQSIAKFQQEKLPLPGAIAMLSAAAHEISGGDAGYVAEAICKIPNIKKINDRKYFKNVDIDNPLLLPGESPEILSKFPASLLAVGTRDYTLSSVVHTHSQMVNLGVEAYLHVWEGLGHVFFYDSNIPESREVYDVIVRFFDKHLGPSN